MNIKIRSAEGDELQFKVRRNTKLLKLFAAYAQRKNEAVGALRFKYDGVRIENDDTAETLGIEDLDSIDCFMHQTGGNIVNNSNY